MGQSENNSGARSQYSFAVRCSTRELLLERDQRAMSTYDHKSNLAHCIAYPRIAVPGMPGDSRIAVLPGKESSTAQAVNEDARLLQGTLLESGGKPRLWAPVGALVFQVLLVTVLAISGLFHTEELPKRETVTMLFAPPTSAPGGVSVPAPKLKSTFASISSGIPTPMRKSQEAPPSRVDTTGGMVGGLPGGMAGGLPGGLPSEVLGSTRSVPVLEKTPEPANKRMRIASRVAEANLIYDVAPKYPPEAGRERIEGTVELLAVIGKDGTVRDVQVKRGLPVLVQAAIDAVKQWRYKPYLMNGEPIEVDCQITINFTLARG